MTLINLVTLYSACQSKSIADVQKVLSLVSYLCPHIEPNGSKPDDPLPIICSFLELYYTHILSASLPEVSVQSLTVGAQTEIPVLDLDATPIIAVHFKRLQWNNLKKKVYYNSSAVHLNQLPQTYLTSCILFNGTENGGHYYALVKKHGLWFKLDDNKPIQKKAWDASYVREHVYLALYTKDRNFQRPLQLIGLQNVGSSCFINSALQVFLHSIHQ